MPLHKGINPDWLNGINPSLHDQVVELLTRARNSVTNQKVRAKVLEDVADLLCNIDHDDWSLDGDAIINDNDCDGYWVTCRVFVRYRDRE
jgi:hypothetical protein